VNRRLSFIAALCTATAVVAACASPQTWPSQDANGLHIPSIVWPEGPPNLDDERVSTIINAEVILAAANNAHDYSSPTLRLYLSEEYITRQAKLSGGSAVDPGGASADFPYYFTAGPDPLKVEEVRDTGTKAEVDVCAGGGGYPWINNNDDVDPVAYLGEHKTGVAWIYVLTRQSDGTFLVSDSHLRSADDCSTNNIKYGIFDPQPPYGDVVHEDEFIQPDGSHGRLDDGDAS